MYRFPTDKDYEGLPAKRIQRIKNTFCEDDSWAFRYLKFHIKAKDFLKILREEFNLGETDEVDGTVYNNLYQVTREEKPRVSYAVIFKCRHLIPPLYWYYNWKEELPEATKYTKKYDAFTEEMAGTETLGHLKLKSLIEDYGINNLAQKLNVNLSDAIIKNIYYKRRRQTGAVTFKSLPSFDTINALKDWIKPDLWYIFPDEIE